MVADWPAPKTSARVVMMFPRPSASAFRSLSIVCRPCYRSEVVEPRYGTRRINEVSTPYAGRHDRQPAAVLLPVSLELPNR